MIDPKSSKTIGFHLFFEPDGVLKHELSSVIANLAGEYGGPVFTPHVTLLARIPGEESQSYEEIIAKTNALARTLSSFFITLDTLEAKDAYFKALYVTVQNQEQLHALHVKALDAFSMTDESPYTPHLSLLYGNYSQEQKQESINSLVLQTEHSFLVKSLYLYKTEGEVQNWKLLKEFPFGE